MSEIDGSFFGSLWYTFKKLVHRIIHSEVTQATINAPGNLLSDFKVLYVEDQYYSKAYRAKFKFDVPEAIFDECGDDDPAPDYQDDKSDVSSTNQGEILPELFVKVDTTAFNGDIQSAEPVNLPTYTISGNIDPMRQAFSYASIPRSFMPGHCAMQSIWQCFPDHLRPKAKEVMACTSKLLMQQVNNDGTRLYNDGEIASYIIGGNWNQPLSAAIIPILAKFYNLSVVIKISGQPDDYVNTVPGQAHHVINWAAGHYFVRKRGGAISKFDGLIDKLIEVVEGCDDTIAGDIIELSAAPGYLLNEIIGKFDTKGYPCYYHAGIYTGVGSARFTQNLDSIKYQKYSDRFDNIFGTKKFDYIISDAASAVNTEVLVKRAVEFAGRRLNKNGTLVIKTFADPHCVYEFATKFAKVECCDGAASERYFILYNFSGGDAKADFYEIYDRFHRDLTDHSYSFSGNDVLRYYEHHFKEFRKFKPMLDILPNRQYAGSFKAITGFASASKTTRAVKLYPSAKFVAPTSELSLRHNKDFGVVSFTPHVLFSSNIHDGDTIVIDELSQFCVEFVAMLKIFRNVNVVVVGDV